MEHLQDFLVELLREFRSGLLEKFSRNYQRNNRWCVMRDVDEFQVELVEAFVVEYPCRISRVIEECNT